METRLTKIKGRAESEFALTQLLPAPAGTLTANDDRGNNNAERVSPPLSQDHCLAQHSAPLRFSFGSPLAD
jgi:hypothetical protein